MGTTRGRRYDKDEFVKRGAIIFEKEIRAKGEGRNPRHFLAIDVGTGAYEVDESEMAA